MIDWLHHMPEDALYRRLGRSGWWGMAWREQAEFVTARFVLLPSGGISIACAPYIPIVDNIRSRGSLSR